MDARNVMTIDEKLLDDLETLYKTFCELRKRSSDEQELTQALYKLNEAFNKVIDARNKSTMDAIAQEKSDNIFQLLQSGTFDDHYSIQLPINWPVERLLDKVNKEILDYYAQATKKKDD